MMRIMYLFFSVFLMVVSNLYAQSDDMRDIVYLKNGHIVRGTITERVSGETVSIRTRSGHVSTYEMSQVRKITQNPSASIPELRVNVSLGQNDNNPGLGAGGGFFIPLDKNFSLGAMGSFYSFQQSSGSSGSEDGASVSNSSSQSLRFIEGLGVLKYRFDQAYIFGGVGIVDVLSSASVTETITDPFGSGTITTQDSESSFHVGPVFAIGGGVNFPIESKVDLFIQAKESLVIGSSDIETIYSNLVLLVPSNESYTIFEGGFAFDLK